MRIRIRNRARTLHNVSLAVVGKLPKGFRICPNRKSKDSVMWTYENVDLTFTSMIVEISEECRGTNEDYSDIIINGQIVVGYVDCGEYALLKEKVV